MSYDQDPYSIFHAAVYSQDTPDDGPHGWIQWKGTKACIDVYCSCGNHGHIDATFFYFYRCSCCNKKYAVGQVVKLIELTAEQAEYVETSDIGFVTDDECGTDDEAEDA